MNKLLAVLIPLLFLSFLCKAGLATETQPLPGQVLIKLKPSFAYLNADGSRLKSNHWKQIVPTADIRESFSFGSFGGNKTAKSVPGAGRSGIDLRLYHQLRFNAELPLPQVMEQLYKSGVVELVEPVYPAVTFQSPNDPYLGSQYYLNVIKAQQAWQISRGSREIIVAVVDSGVDMKHPDLQENLYTNQADPVDGLDNDGDGFVDNYWGWDFAGRDYLMLRGDHDPHTTLYNASHGTLVAGSASAVPDNGIGIAGTGFNTRLMVLKHTADNDSRNNGTGYLENVMQGIMYAATHGADIINASFGSGYYSQIEQDLLKVVSLEYGVLVVAAAGNSNNEAPMYPAAYAHVLAVGASTQSDLRASFSSYGHHVDLTAPGESVMTTKAGGAYVSASGTSYAAPIVAGAAALLKAKYPTFNAEQLGQLLRVSADTEFAAKLEAKYQGKMGVGRLDLQKAFAYSGPSLKLESMAVKGLEAEIAKAGEEAQVFCEFKNLLWPGKALEVKLISMHSQVEVLQPLVVLDEVAMQQMVSNAGMPFRLKIDGALPENTPVKFRLEYSAAGYRDYQYITVEVNQNYLDIHENRITTTLASNGRIGYGDPSRKKGRGFCLEDRNMLYEMGLIVATSAGQVLSNVRAVDYGVDDDFREFRRVNRHAPGSLADVEVFGSFDDSGDSLSRLNLLFDYRLFAWHESPYDESLILQYIIKNKGNETVKDLYAGLFADWDVTPRYALDRASWDSLTQTGYVYSAMEDQQTVGAVQLLTGQPHYWAFENFNEDEQEPVMLGDGFSDEEKFRAISSGVARAEAGMAEEEGTDVSHVLAAGPYEIAPGDSVVLAFALHAGSSREKMLSAAQLVKERYEYKLLPHFEKIAPGTFPKAYPNPSEGEVKIQLPARSTHPYQVRIMDSSGRFVAESFYPAGQLQLLIGVPRVRGLYLMEISGGPHRSLQRIMVR